jgi:hypothetical protein
MGLTAGIATHRLNMSSPGSPQDLHELPLADLAVARSRGRALQEQADDVDPRLPDFVYFNHSIHVKKGMGCETCHGRIDQMPLTKQQNSLQMEWCINCHRNPQDYVRPREEVFTMGYRPPEDPAQRSKLVAKLMDDYKIKPSTDCSTCHR